MTLASLYPVMAVQIMAIVSSLIYNKDEVRVQAVQRSTVLRLQQGWPALLPLASNLR